MPFKNHQEQIEYLRNWGIANKEKKRESYHKWATSERGRQFLHARDQRLIGTIEGKARNKIRNRIYRKKMPHASFFLCTDCTNHAVHYHHEDYSLWWFIEPLCHACHGKRHRLH